MYAQVTRTKPKRRPFAEGIDGFMATGRSAAAQAEKLGFVSSMCTVVSSTTGPIMSHTQVQGRGGGFADRSLGQGLLNLMWSPPPPPPVAGYASGPFHAEVPLDRLGPLDPQVRQWSDLPPLVLQNPQFFSETTPAFRQNPQLQLTLVRDEVFGPGAGQGPYLVPQGELDRSRFHSPIVVGDGSVSAPSSFRLERPLLTFDGTKGPEDFERFCRTFGVYVDSHGAGRYGLHMVETWLEGTPLLVYQQFLRDRLDGTFAGLKETLREDFGQPLDGCLAAHKLQSVHWGEGQSLVQLATEIRELHYRAHPSLAEEYRESYAGDRSLRSFVAFRRSGKLS